MSVPAGRPAASSQSSTSIGAPPKLETIVTPQMNVQRSSFIGSLMLLWPTRNGEKICDCNRKTERFGHVEIVLARLSAAANEARADLITALLHSRRVSRARIWQAERCFPFRDEPR